MSVGDRYTVDEERDLAKELATVRLMVEIYCRHRHESPGGLCANCAGLLDYVGQRLSRCPHGAHKMPCKNCRIGCYREPWKTQIREVMRFAGPRLIMYHPVLAIRHAWAGLRRR